MYTFNDTKFHWQRRWMCLWQKANKRELDCNELSWWKRWLRWTRANKQRLDHVGLFFIFIKAVSGWNAQQKCQPVLSWLSSQSSTHFLDICRKPFPPILDNVTRQCLSAKHRRFSYEKPKGEKKKYKWRLFFLILLYSIYEKNSMHCAWKAFRTSKDGFDKWAKAKQDTDIPPSVQAKPFYLAWYHAFPSWSTFYYNGDLNFPQALCVTDIVLNKWLWFI